MNFIPNVSSSSSPSHSSVSLLSLEQNPHCREFMLSILTCATHSFLPHSTIIIKQLNNPCHLLHKNNNNRSSSSSTTAQSMKNIKNIEVSAKSAFILFNLYLQFYVNAGLMNEARNLFDETHDRTLIQWTILMSGYIRHGPTIETLSVFRNLLEDHNLKPDSYVYAVVIRACSTLVNLDFGREVHCRILKTDGAMDLFVENALVTMYSSCGSVEDAVRVFDGISRPDLVSWSSMLNGYVQNGFEEEGLRLFIMMIQNGICPDAFAFSMVVGASTHLGYLDLGVQVHCYIVKTGFGSCLFLENSLIDFYAKCGDPDSSKKVFHQMTERNLVSWNTVIKGSVHNVDYHDALRLFRALMNETLHCDDFTLPAVLKAITGLGALHYGKQVHGYIIRAGFESNVYVISSLLDMYIECIDHESSEAIKDFPPKIFNSLKEIEYDEFITASILKWCSLEVDLETGKAIHSQIIKHNQLSDSYVLSSLIDMYAKCGIPEAAQRVFVRIKNKSMVPWSAVISGHCWNGWFEEALKFFQKMQSDGIEANEYIYTSVLLACLALGYVNKGRELHCKILRTGFGSNVSVVNTLINLYSELMGHQQALKLCTLIPEAEVSWDFLIQACLRVQAHETVFKLVQRIQQVQGKLDSTTASYILSSCANPVLLNAGTQLQAYVTKRGLMSDPLTSNSLIKMYSGCGKVTDSIAAFNQSPVKNSDSWTSIISTHVDHGHPSQAIELFTQLRQKNRLLNKDTFIFALKAYAQMGMVDEVFRLFISMDQSYGIKPSIEHYSYMVEVLGRAGKFEEAQEYINGVFPLKPEPLIWRPLLSACRVHGNIRVVKYVVEKLIEFEPSDFTANLLLKQVLLTEGKWDEASKMKTFNKSVRSSSSWIEIRNKIYEFVSGQIPSKFISDKLAEMERTMEGLGYIGDRNHLLHNAEEEDYAGVGLHHTEMKALAFGLLSSPAGVPIRIMKSVRMCGDCHSACKFMSTFLGRDLVVKDTCSYHHFENGKCSCRDTW